MTDREEFEAWFSQKGRFPKDVERSGEGYKEENATRSWAAWQAARATAEQSEPLTREQILDLCCEFGQDFINGHCTDVWGLLIHLYGLERALKSQQDAAIEAKQAEQPDTQRLDFMLANTAFTVACNRDGSILQYQLMMQDEDEVYHVLHNERRFYNTEREAIDAAIESQRSGDGS